MVGELISEWLTPTSLFILLNIVIATILFISTASRHPINKHPRPDNNHQHHHLEDRPPQLQLARSPSLFSRMTSFNQISHPDQPDEAVPPPIARAPSLLSRVASFRLSGSLCRPDPAAQPAQPAQQEEEEEEEEKRETASFKRETTSFKREWDEEVDAKADDFIHKFKQQLKLQRLESLLRYRNNRDTTAATT